MWDTDILNEDGLTVVDEFKDLFGIRDHLYVNTSLNQGYLTIPKNGMVSFKLGINHEWSNVYSDEDILDLDFVVVPIRDPMSRFISALNMQIERPHWPNEYPLNLFSNKQQNVHFLPQTYYIKLLQSVGKVELKYVYVHGNIMNDLNKLFNWNVNPVHTHKSKSYIIQDVNEELVKKWYKDDYDLIESVTFVN